LLVSIVLASSFPEVVAIKRENTGAVDTRVEESETNAARLEPVQGEKREERRDLKRYLLEFCCFEKNFFEQKKLAAEKI